MDFCLLVLAALVKQLLQESLQNRLIVKMELAPIHVENVKLA